MAGDGPRFASSFVDLQIMESVAAISRTERMTNAIPAAFIEGFWVGI
jgi:hypothetical protein